MLTVIDGNRLLGISEQVTENAGPLSVDAMEDGGLGCDLLNDV